jgi:hypothetical protein
VQKIAEEESNYDGEMGDLAKKRKLKKKKKKPVEAFVEPNG